MPEQVRTTGIVELRIHLGSRATVAAKARLDEAGLVVLGALALAGAVELSAHRANERFVSGEILNYLLDLKSLPEFGNSDRIIAWTI